MKRQKILSGNELVDPLTINIEGGDNGVPSEPPPIATQPFSSEAMPFDLSGGEPSSSSTSTSSGSSSASLSATSDVGNLRRKQDEERRKAKNREKTRRWRERRDRLFTELEETNKRLLVENSSLKAELEATRWEAFHVRTELKKVRALAVDFARQLGIHWNGSLSSSQSAHQRVSSPGRSPPSPSPPQTMQSQSQSPQPVSTPLPRMPPSLLHSGQIPAPPQATVTITSIGPEESIIEQKLRTLKQSLQEDAASSARQCCP